MRYQGSFQYDNPHGKISYEINKTKYEENFVHGKRNGYSEITCKSSGGEYQYKGQMFFDKKAGPGKEITKDYIYDGTFGNDQINGKGKIIYINKEEEFEGTLIYLSVSLPLKRLFSIDGAVVLE